LQETHYQFSLFSTIVLIIFILKKVLSIFGVEIESVKLIKKNLSIM